MLSANKLNEIITTLGIGPNGRQKIDEVRNSNPTRNVEGGAGNVACRYPSKKMRQIIQAESHQNELAALYLWDHDTATHEFYDQPPKIKINYIDSKGKRRAHLTTPDYFIIQDDFVGWVECKTEEWLQKREGENSTLFVRGSDGLWTCPPGEAFAAQYGLSFKLRSSAENPPTYIRNLIFLSDYWNTSPPPEYQTNRAILTANFDSRIWCHLSELLSKQPAMADIIFHAIVREELFVDLFKDPLAEPEYTRVYRDKVAAEAVQIRSHQLSQDISHLDLCSIRLKRDEKLDWDGAAYTIKTVGDNSVFLEDDRGELITLSNEQVDALARKGLLRGMRSDSKQGRSLAEDVVCTAAPIDLEHAVSRLKCLQGNVGGAGSARQKSDRTLRHWSQLRRSGELMYGDGFVGLISRVSHRGNSTRKIDDKVIETMKDVIEHDFQGADAKSITICYGILRARCADLNLIPPSEKTFRRAIKTGYSKFEMTDLREGARAAYKLEPFVYVLEHSTPRHGDRPFEIGHIDHTELDIQLVGSKFGETLKRPWLTLLLDAYSRAVLATVITFDPPSYRSCMLVIRDCIRRHGRVPSILVVDRGAEFDSVYFETLLARLEVMKKSRPPQKPRFGSIMERFFGVSNTQLIHNMRGNNKALQKPRQMASTHDPRLRAVWTLGTLVQRFEEFVYGIYGNQDHSTLGVSPNSALKTGLAKTGTRTMRLIPYTPELELLCLPSTPKGTARINPSRGIKIGYLYYRHPLMSDPRRAGEDVPVRYDPFNIAKAYAYITGAWLPCESEFAKVFQDRTEREIATIAGEINGKNKLTGQRRAINAERIARFIIQLEGTEVTLLQQKRDAERRCSNTCDSPAGTDDSDSSEEFSNSVPDNIWSNVDVPSFGVFK